MTIDVVIFDFDGTLVDTFEALLKIVKKIGEEWHFPIPNSQEIEVFKNLNSRQIIYQSGINVFKLPFLLRKVKQELNQDISQVSLIAGMAEALLALRQQGCRLGIITSNSQVNVSSILEKYNLVNTFDFIYTEISLFGKHRTIRRMLEENNLRANQVIYVGDETRDIEAARRSKIKVIAVNWGFNSPQVLAAHNPDFLINHPAELPALVVSLR